MSATTDKKEAMKSLRKERKHWVARSSTAMKAQKMMRTAIQGCLQTDSATVPQIAGQTQISACEVLWFIATMKKYGQVVEDGKDGDYYRYASVTAKKNTK